MDDPAGGDPVMGPADGTALFGEARALIEAAEAEAQAIVAFAARRARSRENEAELLVAKARRVLVAAERKAEVILTTARTAAETVATIDLRDGQGEAGSAGGSHASRTNTRLDQLLASAISSAVDEAFPVDAGARSG